MKPRHAQVLSKLFPFAVFLVLLAALAAAVGRFFPPEGGNVGHDFALALPAYLDGYLWFRGNGIFAVPWFTPAFCAGQPFFADPQSVYYSLPQWLSFVVDPLAACRVSTLVFCSAGFGGFYLLCRRALGMGAGAATAAGSLAMLNGFTIYRMAVGEVGFLPFLLTGLVAFFLLAPREPGLGPLRRGGNALLAGLCGACMLHGGLTTLMAPAALSVVGVALAARLMRRGAGAGTFLARSLAALAWCVALCASKLSASLAFASLFSRDFYHLPGFGSLADAARFSLGSLFLSSQSLAKPALARLSGAQWLVLPHEWAYGFGPPALVFLAAAGGAAVFLAVRGRRAAAPAGDTAAPRSWRDAAAAVALGLVCLVPLLLLWREPGWNALLKSLPLVGSTHWPMRWIVVWIPLVCVAAAAALERCGLREDWRKGAALLLALSTAAWLLGEDVAYYVSPQNRLYDPGRVTRAWREARDGKDFSVRALADFDTMPDGLDGTAPSRNDAMTRGVSTIFCYNPIFGYRLEALPVKGSAAGSIWREKDGALNVKNPACYVFPRENGCAPGDSFAADAGGRAAAAAFAARRPFPFARSGRQRAADWLTLCALLAALLLAGWGAIFRARLHLRRSSLKLNRSGNVK